MPLNFQPAGEQRLRSSGRQTVCGRSLSTHPEAIASCHNSAEGIMRVLSDQSNTRSISNVGRLHHTVTGRCSHETTQHSRGR